MPAAFEANYTGSGFWNKTRRYVINRLLRVYPLYWLALLVTVVINARLGGWEFKYALEHPETFVQNFLLLGLNQAELWGRDVRFIGPAWTLDIEIQYYLLAPFLLTLWRHRPGVVTFVLIVWSCIAVWLRLAGPTLPAGISGSLLVWIPEFAIGFLSYTYRSQLKVRMPRRPKKLSAFFGDLSFPLYLRSRVKIS